LTYASAGWQYTALDQDGKPLSAILKFGYREDGCVYSGKIIMLDEAHNLVRADTMYKEQLKELQQQLFLAQDCVLAAFTGTMIPDHAEGGRQLLDTIKGSNHTNSCDEGFLASLANIGPPLFPQVIPAGIPNSELTPRLQAQLVRRVILKSEALRSYYGRLASSMPCRQLQKYCNIASHCCSFHGQHRAVMLEQPQHHMPKLAAIAAAICRRREKSAVIISRQGGYIAMVACMRQAAERASPPFGVATGEELSEFNDPSNSRGEVLLVLIASLRSFLKAFRFEVSGTFSWPMSQTQLSCSSSSVGEQQECLDIINCQHRSASSLW